MQVGDFQVCLSEVAAQPQRLKVKAAKASWRKLMDLFGCSVCYGMVRVSWCQYYFAGAALVEAVLRHAEQSLAAAEEAKSRLATVGDWANFTA